MKVRLLTDGGYVRAGDIVGKVFDAKEESGGISIVGYYLNEKIESKSFDDYESIIFSPEEYEVVEDDDVHACSEPLQGSINAIVNYDSPQPTVPIQFVVLEGFDNDEREQFVTDLGVSVIDGDKCKVVQIGAVLYVTAKDDKYESQS